MKRNTSNRSPAMPFAAQMSRAALESAAGAIIIIDENGIILTANPSTADIFGFSEAELVGQNVSLLMPEPFRSRHDGYIRHHLKTGERRIIGIGRQVMALKKSGAIFPAHLAVSTFEVAGQRFFTGIVHDLSAQSDPHLREQPLLQSVFNQLPDAVLVLGPSGTIRLCNAAVADVFGYAPEELIGQPFSVLCGDTAELSRVLAITAGLARDGGRADTPIGFRHKLGKPTPCRSAITVARDQANAVVGYLFLCRDITQQVEQEEALRRSQRLEALGQLTGGIAHDFNNLLTIIQGNLELLEDDIEDPEQRDLLGRANNAALMGGRLTNRLLTFARRRRLEPVVLDLNEQIMGMAELLRRTIGENIALGTLLAPRLWKVRADPSEIENALLNLAINARDAMPGGGKLVLETANLTLRAGDAPAGAGLEPGAYVRLSVTDSGSGMTQEVLGRAFEPFFTTKQPGKGTGLGLSVIYGFVKQSGGHLTAASEPGRGTSITIYLPRVREVVARGHAPSRSRARKRAHGTVLLVEDNPEVRAVTARRMRNLGYTVLEAESGPKAMEVLKSGTMPDLVFSDVVMPEMSGFRLAEWIRANAPGVRVVLTSGFAQDETRGGEAPMPGVAILRKPYTAPVLARTLRRAIEGGT
jgi:PAS domain S-box-containing protein